MNEGVFNIIKGNGVNCLNKGLNKVRGILGSEFFDEGFDFSNGSEPFKQP